MRKRLWALGLAAVLASSLIGCSGSSSSGQTTSAENETTAAASDETTIAAENETEPASAGDYNGPEYTLQLGHAGADGSIEDQISKKFKELVEEKSGGKIQIDLFGNAQMGGLSDLVDAVRYNTIDLAIFAIIDADSYYQKADIITLPYLFSDFSHVESFYESDIYQNMLDEFAEQTGCRELSSFHAGFRVVLSNKAIHSAEDMEGLTIRVPEIQSYVKTFSALGCNTVTLPASEVYQGLSTGLIEATEAAPSYMRTQNYHDQAQYCIMTRHIYCGNSLFMPQEKLDSLDPSAAALIQEAASEAGAYARTIAEAEDADALKAFEEAGLEVITPDVDSFKAKMSEVWGELVLNKLDDGQTIVDGIEALASK